MNTDAITSNTEFDLVTRVQITNEVPPVSLWSLIPNGLQNTFWKYIIGTVNVTEGDELNPPTKVVNGVQAPSYGPPVGDPTYSSFDSINIEGVITPEIDFILHEMYRYLGTFYPTHPDFQYLLTTLELDAAFEAVTSIIDYHPDYTFLSSWSASYTGTRNPYEETKWKIRDLRSYAYKRKFAGSYLGYKMFASDIGKHCGVYNVATYNALDFQQINTEDSLHNRNIRFLDYFGHNEANRMFSADNTLLYTVLPNKNSIAYVLDSDFEIAQDVTTQGKLFNDQEDLLGYVIGRGLERNSLEQYVSHIQTSTSFRPVGAVFPVVKATDVTEEQFDLQVFVDPINLGTFKIDYKEAMTLYPFNKDDVQVPYKEVVPGTHIMTCVDDTGIIPLTYGALIQERVLGTIEFQVATLEMLEAISTTETFYLTVPMKSEQGHTVQVVLIGTVKASESAAIFTILSIPDEDQNRLNIYNHYRDPFYVGSTVTLRPITNKNDSILSGTTKSADWGSFITTSLLPDKRTGDLINSHNQPGFVTEPEMSAEAAAVWLAQKTQNAILVATTIEDIKVLGYVYTAGFEEIEIDSSSISKLANFAPGNIVRGKGIITGTYIKQVKDQTLILSQGPTLTGTILLTVSCSSNVEEVQNPIDFKSSLQYSTDFYKRSTVFRSLWPSHLYPNTSLGYIEGINNLSSFAEDYKQTYDHVTDEHRLDFSNILQVECSLDSVLYHKNTVGSTSYGLGNTCLIDTPWLDYITAAVGDHQRASDKVRVGCQLTMMTDTSGLYTLQTGQLYTDPTIQSQFMILKEAYNSDPQAAYLQLGTGGFSSQVDKAFLNPDDLLRPALYGDTLYDSNREFTETPGKRSTYRNVENATKLPPPNADDLPTHFSGVEEPLFEVPLTQYETFKLVDPVNEDNIYNVIQTSIYEESAVDNSLRATLKINNPLKENGFDVLEPDNYRYLGLWVPTTSKDLAEGTVKYPDILYEKDGYSEEFYYYYIVSEDVVIEGPSENISFQKGDWVLFDWEDQQWKVRVWELLGVLGDLPGDGDEIFAPTLQDIIDLLLVAQQHGLAKDFSGDVLEYLDSHILYYVAAKDFNLNKKATVNDDGAIVVEQVPVKQDDWIMITKELAVGGTTRRYTDASGRPLLVYDNETLNPKNEEHLKHLIIDNYPPWNVIQGNSYDNLRQPFFKGLLGESFTNFKNRRVNLLENIIYSQPLSRKFLSQGTFNGSLLYKFPLKCKNTVGNMYSITESDIRFDAENKQYYTQLADSGPKNYIAFGEPIWYKNLHKVTGAVRKSDRKTLVPATGVYSEFAIQPLQRGDTLIHSKKVAVRDSNPVNKDCLFYSHYVEMRGMYEEITYVDGTETVQALKMTPSINGKYPIVAQENFRIALKHLELADKVVSSIPGYELQYKDEYETKYFKNLLVVAGKVLKSDPYTLVPATTGIEDRQAFTNAVKLARKGDTVVDAYCEDGTTLTQGRSKLFEGSENRNVQLRASCYLSGLWTMVGTDGFIATVTQNSSDAGAWYIDNWQQRRIQTDDIQEHFTSVASATVERTLFAGTEAGNIYHSTDNGITWEQYISAGLAIASGGIDRQLISGAIVAPRIITMKESSYNPATDDGAWDVAELEKAQVAFITESGMFGVYQQHRADQLSGILTDGIEGADWKVFALPASYSLPDLGDTESTEHGDLTVDGEGQLVFGWWHEGYVSYPRDIASGDGYWMVVGDNGLISKATHKTLKEMHTSTVNPDGSDINIPTNPFEDTHTIRVDYGEGADSDYHRWFIEGITQTYSEDWETEWDIMDSIPPEDANIFILSGISFSEKNIDVSDDSTTGTWIAVGYKLFSKETMLLKSTDVGSSWTVIRTWEAVDLADYTSKARMTEDEKVYEFPTDTTESIATAESVVYMDSEWLLFGPTMSAVLYSLDGVEWNIKDYNLNPDIKGISNIHSSKTGTRIYIGNYASSYFDPEDATHIIKDKMFLSINDVFLDGNALTVVESGTRGNLNITLDGKLVEDERWKDMNSGVEEEKIVLISVNTVSNIEGFEGMAPSRLPNFVGDSGSLYVREALQTDSSAGANRVYFPRSNTDLTTQGFVLPGADGVDIYVPNERYMGRSGYPLYAENKEVYRTTNSGTPSTFKNRANQSIYTCDSTGRYISAEYEVIPYEEFVDMESSPDLFVDYLKVRNESVAPIYSTYGAWLSAGNEIKIRDGEENLNIGSSVTVLEVFNDPASEEIPYCIIKGSAIAHKVLLTTEALDAFVLTFLPKDPKLILNQSAPAYMTDEDGRNRGFQAINLNGSVYYSLTPMTNEKFIPDGALLADTVGANIGLAASPDITDEGLLDSIYTMQPIRYLQSSIIMTDEGTLIQDPMYIRDEYGNSSLGQVVTLEDKSVTGIYFPESGYGSWLYGPSIIRKESPEDNLYPWENDRQAFYTYPIYENGAVKEEKFLYMKNFLGDIIHLCDRDGTLILSEHGYPIPVPAMKSFSYEQFILDEGLVGGIENIETNLEIGNPQVVVDYNGVSSLVVAKDIIDIDAYAEGQEEVIVQMIFLTAKNVDSTAFDCTDPIMRKRLYAPDLYTYDPDRVYYGNTECLYPTVQQDPSKWDEGIIYANKEGLPIYVCDEVGDYTQVSTDGEAIPISKQTFSARTTQITPIYKSCQDWFEVDFYDDTTPSNPYWQWINVLEKVDSHLKQSVQQISITKMKKIRGSLTSQVVTNTDESYLDILNPFSVTVTDSSVTTQDADIINHAEGTISFIPYVRDFGLLDDFIIQTDDVKQQRNDLLNTTFSQYGMKIYTDWEEAFPNNIFEDQVDTPYVDLYELRSPLQGEVDGLWTLNYKLNSLRSFRAQGSMDSVAAIREVGVYNKDRQLIAYGRFPAIIYDTSKNHLSLNLFIKEGAATALDRENT